MNYNTSLNKKQILYAIKYGLKPIAKQYGASLKISHNKPKQDLEISGYFYQDFHRIEINLFKTKDDKYPSLRSLFSAFFHELAHFILCKNGKFHNSYYSHILLNKSQYKKAKNGLSNMLKLEVFTDRLGKKLYGQHLKRNDYYTHYKFRKSNKVELYQYYKEQWDLIQKYL
jgi:hypothetical protein